MCCAEAEDCGLLLSFLFGDVVMLWAVAMVSALPFSFEFPLQKCPGFFVGDGVVEL